MLQPEHLCREGGPGTTVELPPKDAGKVLGHQVGTQRSYHEDRDGIRPRVTQLPLRTDTEKDAPSLFGDQLMRMSTTMGPEWQPRTQGWFKTMNSRDPRTTPKVSPRGLV